MSAERRVRAERRWLCGFSRGLLRELPLTLAVHVTQPRQRVGVRQTPFAALIVGAVGLDLGDLYAESGQT